MANKTIAAPVRVPISAWECGSQADPSDREHAVTTATSLPSLPENLRRRNLLDLSRQQRNLLLMRPIFQLELDKAHYGEEGLFDGLDTHYLVLALLDYLMEGTTVSLGWTINEVIEHMASVAGSMNPSLSPKQRIAVAEIVLGTLDNRRNNYQEFAFDFFDAKAGAPHIFRFRLVRYEPDLEDAYRYRPTREGYLVYLGMLDLSPEDSQELMEKMLQLLVERGRFSEALEIARRARALSIEYRQIIRDQLTQANRAPGSVRWGKGIGPQLDAAREHVVQRQREDQRMIESVRANLKAAEEVPVRQDLEILAKTIENATLIRTQLLNDIVLAPQRFLDAQRMVFRVRRASNLPDLDARIFPELLQLPIGKLAANSETVIASLYPGLFPHLYDLNSAFAGLLERRRQEETPDRDDGEIIPLELPPVQFPDKMIRDVQTWLAEKLLRPKETAVESLLAQAKKDGFSADARRLMVFMLYRSFSPLENLFEGVRADAAGRKFHSDVAEGDSIVFSNSKEMS